MSNIDVTKPVYGNPTTQSVRDNFQFAKTEIEALQTFQAAGPYLTLAGGTLTGPLTLAADPVNNLHAVTKQYSDTKLPIAGGTLTGFLTLNADPTAPLHAATKQYADLKLALTGGTLTGGLTGTTATFGGSITAGLGSSGNGIFVMNAPSGSTRAFRWQTNGVNRWQITLTGAESSANVGSDWALGRLDDTGANLGTPIAINRATGVITLGQLAAGLTVGDGTTVLNNILSINAASGTRILRWQTASNLRWTHGVSGAESTGNAGSDWTIGRYNDAGTLTDNVMTINRNTGGMRLTQGFAVWNATVPAAKPAITGSRGGNAALASLLTQLATYGLFTDSTTA